MFNLYSFLAYIFITAYTPGPNNIMSMSNGISFGFRKSLPFNLGIFCGFSFVMLLCTIFSATLFKIMPTIKPFMLVIGSTYMLWLAWKIHNSSSNIEMKESKNNSFLSGMLLQFINPKIIIYGITSMSSFILPHFSDTYILVGFALSLAFIGFTGTLCWSAFGAIFYRLFSKYTKITNLIMALLLVYCAISLFL